MEDCWELLGIAPTADTTAIKKAYAKQLKVNKPDKNPAGFRDLRAAYERALDESYWYEEDEDENEEEKEDTASFLANTVAEHPNSALSNGADARIEGDTSYQTVNHANISTTVAPADGDSVDIMDCAVDEAGDFKEHSLEKADFAKESLEEADLADFEADESFSTAFFTSSAWTSEWQQIAETNESDASQRDQRLQTLLHTQINTPRSLDEQNDFEEALLVWLAEQPPVFTGSYQLAKTNFRWDRRLEHWSRNDYPWFMLESLDERYQHVTYFQTPTAFREFLTRHFPTVASYWPIEALNTIDSKEAGQLANSDIEPIKLKRSQVFRQLFFPFRVIELAQELTALDTELDYYSHDHPAAHDLAEANNPGLTPRYWQHDSPLTDFKAWILRRFIYPQDFILIGVIVAAVVGILSLFSAQPRQNFYNDGWGVFAVVSLYYLFWQAQLRLFAAPHGLVSYEPWHTGWRNASIALFIMGYISWLDISNLNPLTMPTSPIYFLTHIAGASLLLAITTRQPNKVVTAVSWYAGLLLLVLTVLIPLLVLKIGNPPYTNIDTLPISPLFWILLAAPAWFVSLGDTYPRLEWLANIGYQLLKVWHYLMLVGGFVLFTYCADILPKIHFGFTALTTMAIALIMAFSMAVILEPFSDH